MIGVRVAAGADAIAVATLCREATDELASARGGALLAGDPGRSSCLGLDEELSALSLANAGTAAQGLPFEWLLGTVGHRTVGVSLVRASERLGSLVGVLEILYVEPSARRLGVGRALVERASSWSKAQRCVGLDVAALPGERAAKVFLEGAGFKARLIVMHRELGEHGEV